MKPPSSGLPASVPPAWFDDLYARDPDPWRFASSDYERGKYEHTLASLPERRFASALEVGCSIGVLTRLLAARCARLLAIDAAHAAVAAARTRCAGLPHVECRTARIPAGWPAGKFDLILLSEVLYYLNAADLAETAARAGRALAPGGTILLVHWTGRTDYPLTGDEAAAGFIAAVSPAARLVHHEARRHYRLDRLDGQSPAIQGG